MVQLPFRVPPDTCDECQESIQDGEHYSFILGLNQYSRIEGFAYAQCDDTQHFSCGHSHAKAQVMHCLAEHPPAMPAYRQGVQVYLPSTCATCHGPLGDIAYFYSLTYAMPGKDEDGNYHAPYICQDEHWCCSLTHAKQAASVCLEEHLEHGPHGKEISDERPNPGEHNASE